MRNKILAQAGVALICTGIAFPAMAAVIVDWDHANNTVEADTPYQAGTSNAVAGLINNYNPASAFMSSSIEANYGNQAMYGVFQTQGETKYIEPEAQNFRIENSATKSRTVPPIQTCKALQDSACETATMVWIK
jgi:hypothetical protein